MNNQATNNQAFHVRSALRGCRTIGLLPEVAIDRIVSTAILHRFQRRAKIDIPNDCFVVVGTGLVKASTNVGRAEIITQLAGPRETLRLYESLQFADDPTGYESLARLEYVVMTNDAVVVYVKTIALLAELPGAAAHALALSCGRSEQRAIERMVTTALGSADKRIVAMLVDLVDRFGDIRDDGSAFVPFRFTRTELAALCGMTPETLIRKVSAWTKDGVLGETPTSLEIRNLDELKRVGGM